MWNGIDDEKNHRLRHRSLHRRTLQNIPTVGEVYFITGPLSGNNIIAHIARIALSPTKNRAEGSKTTVTVKASVASPTLALRIDFFVLTPELGAVLLIALPQSTF